MVPIFWETLIQNVMTTVAPQKLSKYLQKRKLPVLYVAYQISVVSGLKYSHQIMANLPKDRVLSSRPFQKVGIDFDGPF